MRLISMGFQVYLTRRAGAAEIGLFELMMSAFGLAAAVAVSGVRLSTIRLLILQPGRGRGVMRLCLGYSLTLGLGAAGGMILLAPTVAGRFLDAPELTGALRLLALTLPCLALSSCLGGWFSAMRQAGRTALIQGAEFLVQMVLSLGALTLLPAGEAAGVCMALAVGTLGADVCSAALAGGLFARESGLRGGERGRGLLPQLLSIAVPDAVGSWIRSGLVSAKHLLIPKGLRRCGQSAQSALAAYGTVQGMVLPVLGFPTVLLGTVSGLLVPEVAECRKRGDRGKLRSMTLRVVHFTLVLGCFAAAVLAVYGGEVGRVLYRSREAEELLRLLAPLAPLMYLDTAVDGVLKGLGLQTASMRINILDAGVSLLLVWQLIPRVGLGGYLFTLYVSESMNLALSWRQLRRETGLRIPLYRSVLAPALAAMLAVLLPALWLGEGGLWPLLPAAGGYYLLLRVLGSVTRRDVRWLWGVLRGKPGERHGFFPKKVVK